MASRVGIAGIEQADEFALRLHQQEGPLGRRIAGKLGQVCRASCKLHRGCEAAILVSGDVAFERGHIWRAVVMGGCCGTATIGITTAQLVE